MNITSVRNTRKKSCNSEWHPYIVLAGARAKNVRKLNFFILNLKTRECHVLKISNF